MGGKYKPRGLPPKITCTGCGKKFQPITRRGKFHGDTCRQRAHRAAGRSENAGVLSSAR
jgi:hypothetical protein